MQWNSTLFKSTSWYNNIDVMPKHVKNKRRRRRWRMWSNNMDSALHLMLREGELLEYDPVLN